MQMNVKQKYYELWQRGCDGCVMTVYVSHDLSEYFSLQRVFLSLDDSKTSECGQDHLHSL